MTTGNGELPAGDAPTIPGIELLSVLGRGGMGFVYRGRQPYIDREVAVKFLDVRSAGDEFEARFRREARILAGLSDPNIVACYQGGTTRDGVCFLVMELVDGPDLRVYIEEHGALDTRTALRLARDVAGALQRACGLGIIHRDVKPGNVFLGRDPDKEAAGDPFPFTVKLGDLGLARPNGGDVEADMDLTTTTTNRMGTPSTMAPEQFYPDRTVDHRADIYGLGCVLFHALTGKVAYPDRSHAAVVRKKLERYGPDPRALDATLPANVSRLVRKMLACDPDERPQSHEEVVAALDEILAQKDLGPRAAFPVRPIALAVVVAVASLWWFFGGRGGPSAGLEVAGERRVRVGQAVELAVVGHEDAGWTWAWRAPGGSDVDWEGEPGRTARFLAPDVPGVTELELVVTGVGPEGGVRSQRIVVEVHPRLGVDVVAVPETSEGEVWTAEAQPSGGELLGEIELEWRIASELCVGQRVVLDGSDVRVAPVATAPPELIVFGRSAEVALPEAQAPYEIALQVDLLERGVAVASRTVVTRVAADNDPPTLAARDDIADPILVLAGESLRVGGVLVDPDTPSTALSHVWHIEDAENLEPAELASLRRRVETAGTELVLAAPSAGARFRLVLEAGDEVARIPALASFRVEVPKLSAIALEPAVSEGERVALEARVPAGFPPRAELSFRWSLAGVETTREETSIVVAPGVAPGGGRQSLPPELVRPSELRSDQLNLEEGGWDTPRVAFRAPDSDGPYELSFELEVSAAGITARAPVAVRVAAEDAPPSLHIAVPDGPPEPLADFRVVATVFDEDSPIGDERFTWEAVQGARLVHALDGESHATARPTASGEVRVAVETESGLRTEHRLHTRGQLELVIDGPNRTAEAQPLFYAPALMRNGEQITDDGIEYTWRATCLRDEEPGSVVRAIFEPGGGADPSPWRALDELGRGREGPTLDFVAPESSGSYRMRIDLVGSGGGLELTAEALILLVRAEDAPPSFAISLPETAPSGSELELPRAGRVRDSDGIVERYQWLVADGDGELAPLGLVVPATSGGHAPLEWLAPDVTAPTPFRFVLRVVYSDATMVDSTPQVLIVTPRAPDVAEGENRVVTWPRPDVSLDSYAGHPAEGSWSVSDPGFVVGGDPTLLDVSSVTTRRLLELELERSTRDPVALHVLVDPALASFASGGVSLVTESEGMQDVAGWEPRLCFPRGATLKPASLGSTDPFLRLRHRSDDRWALARCQWRGKSDPAGFGLLEHPLPTVERWRLDADLGLVGPSALPRAVGLFVSDALAGLDEGRVQLWGVRFRAVEGGVVREEIVRAELVADAGGRWWVDRLDVEHTAAGSSVAALFCEEEEGSGKRYCPLSLSRRGAELELGVGGRRYTRPDDGAFVPTSVAILLEDGLALVKDVELRP